MGATEEECSALVSDLRKNVRDCVFQVEPDFDEEGAFYIVVVSHMYVRHDLTRLLPPEWRASEWRNPDQRAEICVIAKVG